MPKYRMTYFNGRGRAEIMRYLFALGSVEYEDNRIDGEQWPDLKKTMTFGQMPVLEVDGVMIAQSFAIARLVAKRLGLTGKDDIQEALADSYVLTVHEMWDSMTQIFIETDEDRKAELQKIYKEETAPNKLCKLEAILSANPSGYFVGDEMTWADVVVFDMISLLRRRSFSDSDLSAYPNMVALESRIKSLPNLAAWIAKRPDTAF